MRARFFRNLVPTLLLALLPVAGSAAVSIGVSINIAPPALPVYVQPPIPAPGYIWTPGYWAWGDDGYYWVPGTWVLAPAVGLLWTPGYWGWVGGVYVWNAGYWGPHVGFYGGVNYGFGYGGVGFQGGYWEGGRYFYNRSVTNVTNVRIVNVYNRTVINNVNSRVSFNGGEGGLRARPTREELSAGRERHIGITPVQREHAQQAANNRELRASVNGGRPNIAATPRPGAFSGRGVVAARASEGPGRAREPMHAGTERERTDRPPQAQRDAMQHGAASGATHVDRGNEHRGNVPAEQPHVARTDRPERSQPARQSQPAQRSPVDRPQSQQRPQPNVPPNGPAEPRNAPVRAERPAQPERRAAPEPPVARAQPQGAHPGGEQRHGGRGPDQRGDQQDHR
jgi:hypothetical protein